MIKEGNREICETELEVIRRINEGKRIIWANGNIDLSEKTIKKAKKKRVYFIPIGRRSENE